MFAYRITNRLNGKIYIGISVVPERRWKVHLRLAARGQGFVLHSAIAKHGAANFDFEVIACCRNAADLAATEQALIAQHGSLWNDGQGYNITAGGIGPNGLVMSEATREKFRAREYSAETRAKMAQSARARAARGDHPRAGKRHSDDAKAKIAAANAGRRGATRSPEAKARMSAAQFWRNRCKAEGWFYAPGDANL